MMTLAFQFRILAVPNSINFPNDIYHNEVGIFFVDIEHCQLAIEFLKCLADVMSVQCTSFAVTPMCTNDHTGILFSK